MNLDLLDKGFIPEEICLKLPDNFSDIEEQFEYYSARPKLALEIIENAHEYVRPFENLERQYRLGGLVIDRYSDLIDV